ncbi:MAG: Uma2 family endonuclease, partial [Snowella sp.]
WCDAGGNLIPTPTEREKQRAEQEKQRAEQEKQRAEQAEIEIARLQELLRQAGITINGGLSN